MVTSSPALMSTWARTLHYHDDVTITQSTDLATPPGEMKNLLLLTQLCERKEKVGSTQRPVLGAMLAALVM